MRIYLPFLILSLLGQGVVAHAQACRNGELSVESGAPPEVKKVMMFCRAGSLDLPTAGETLDAMLLVLYQDGRKPGEVSKEISYSGRQKLDKFVRILSSGEHADHKAFINFLQPYVYDEKMTINFNNEAGNVTVPAQTEAMRDFVAAHNDLVTPPLEAADIFDVNKIGEVVESNRKVLKNLMNGGNCNDISQTSGLRIYEIPLDDGEFKGYLPGQEPLSCRIQKQLMAAKAAQDGQGAGANTERND